MKTKNRNNLGGKFNEKQIQRIRNALIYYQDVEPFASDEEREDTLTWYHIRIPRQKSANKSTSGGAPPSK